MADEKQINKYSLDYLVELSNNNLQLEYKYLEVGLEDIVSQAANILSIMELRGLRTPTGQLKRLAVKVSKDEGEKEPEPKVELPDPVILGHGEVGGVMYVGSSGSRLDAIRKRAFSGQIGKTLAEDYEPYTGQPSYFTNLVPLCVEDDYGNVIEPTYDEIKKWRPWIEAEIEKVNPVAIVALGRKAHRALNTTANEWVPHPRSLRIYGNTGEIERKLKRLAKHIIRKQKEQPSSKTEAVPIYKMDEEKQVVYGVVMEPNTYDTDLNWTTPEEIEKAAHHFMEWWREHDAEHTQEQVDAVPVESYVTTEDLDIGGKPVVKGSWVMGLHVRDDELWGNIKSGEYTGFSIEALANIDPDRMLEELSGVS